MKRMGSLIIPLVLLLFLFPVRAAASETKADIWDGTIDTEWFNYKDFSFHLDTAAKFAGFAKLVNDGESFSGVTVYLTSDIDLNNRTWTEIGTTAGDAFDGTFDGGHYSISNINIYKTNYSSSYTVLSGLFGYNAGVIRNVVLASGSHKGVTHCGGIAAYNLTHSVVENCVNYVDIKGGNYSSNFSGVYGDTNVGGIVGCNQGSIFNCTNFGAITYTRGASVRVGGIAGYNLTSSSLISGCTNNGNSKKGGILGVNKGTVDRCINNGAVSNGIVGYNSTDATVKNCINNGEASGAGIVGENSSGLYNCANAGTAAYGICGNNGGTISNCCNYGEITVGSIAPINNITGEITNCYVYEKHVTRVDVAANYATFNASGVLNEGDSRLLIDALNDWVTENGNDYLSWYTNDLFPTLAFNKGVALKENLSLAVGDSTVLVPEIIPGTIIMEPLDWATSAPGVATVSAVGKVTAVAPGTTIITVATADGGYTAVCTVTVTERAFEEYRINNIVVLDPDGNPLSAIPNGTSLATVSITNLASGGDTVVLLAAYTSNGQFRGMMWVSVEDMPVGATIKVTIPVDNFSGKIANLKAFTVASFSNLMPLGEAVSFLPPSSTD